MLLRYSTLLAAILATALFSPIVVWGQQAAGWYVTPSFSLSEVFDDNIFSRSTDENPTSDFISRFTPTIQAGYQSAPLTLLGRYSFDAEVYAKHKELNDAQLRQRASADVKYLPIRSLTLSANGSYTSTETPSDLNVTTGIEEARNRAKSYSFGPSARYEIDPLTAVGSNYSYTQDTRSGGVRSKTDVASMQLERRIGRQDTGTLGYTYRHYQFDQHESTTESDSTTTSHVGSLTWGHEFTAFTGVTLMGGPRFSEGSITPEVSASIRHRLQQGQLSFTYARSQTTSIGQGGTNNTEGFSASASYQPSRFLSLSASPGYNRNKREDSTSKVYSLGLSATYQVSQWLNLVGSYRFSYQDGTSGDTSGGGGSSDRNILRNVAMLQLVINYPYRVD